MKKYQYIIIDDDDIDRIATAFYLKRYPFLQHQASFSKARAALSFIESNPVDIIFLDIDMPEISGLEFQKEINDKNFNTIFITSHPEYALDGFDLDAFDYIVKPLTEERFDNCIGRLKEYLDLHVKAHLYETSFKQGNILIKQGREYVNIEPHQMVYLEALKDYTKINLYDKTTATIHGNLGSVLRNPLFGDFVRCHRSFAVQRSHINIIRTNEIVLTNGITLPLGQYYREAVLKNLP